MKRLAVYLKPFLPRMGVGISFKAVGTLVELAIPWILSYIIDDLIPLKEIRPVCLWGGLMEIAKASGLTATVSRMLSPLLRLLFPNFKKDDPAMNAVSMNITANLLGLGNAATPLGLEAMRGLQANNPTPEIASDEMVNFVVLNTAALHLIPTTVALLRQEYGAAVPMDIMPAAWLTSAAALCVGLAMAWLLRVRRRKRGG